MLAATSAASLAVLVSSDPRTPVVMSAAVALYTVAARTDRPTTWRIGLLTSAYLTAGAMLCGNLPWYAQENFGVFAWLGLAAAAGDAVRSRRAYISAIHERADRAERTREEEARRRVAEERLRIARDLHDVVAHHIALVNVQAGVAAHVMDRRPDQAKEALAHVREASRSALDELRATVGLLRQSGDPEAPTEPAPGLARLDDLAERFRNAGLPVEIACPDRGDPLLGRRRPRRVPGGAGGADQRPQARRARRPRRGQHRPRGRAGRDHRPGRRPHRRAHPGRRPRRTAPGGGHGLLGMRERVTALGGTCTAGPRFGGGFRVHAILPAQGAAPANRPPASVPPARNHAPKDGR
ncbi:sensor histidine kinase [Actinomadura keratinilytica]